MFRKNSVKRLEFREGVDGCIVPVSLYPGWGRRDVASVAHSEAAKVGDPIYVYEIDANSGDSVLIYDTLTGAFNPHWVY